VNIPVDRITQVLAQRQLSTIGQALARLQSDSYQTRADGKLLAEAEARKAQDTVAVTEFCQLVLDLMSPPPPGAEG
jgi:hypothetical protein